MTEAMLHSHYPLQALLYSVVLHRYLRWRLPDYDPERHLGGILYLYVRGMCGPETPEVDGHPVRRLRVAATGGDGRRAVRPAGRSGQGGGVVIDDPARPAARPAGHRPAGASSTAPTSCRRPTCTSPPGSVRSSESRPTTVLLAAALAVRAVRHGSVCVDLATVADLPLEDEPIRRCPWPEPAGWAGRGRGEPVGHRVSCSACTRARLYLDRYWREEGEVCDDLLTRLAGPRPRSTRQLLEAGLDRVFPGDGLRRAAGASARPRPRAGPPSSPAARAPARPPRSPACSP